MKMDWRMEIRCLDFGVKNSLVIPSNPGALFLGSLVKASCTSDSVNGFIISSNRDCLVLEWLVKKNKGTVSPGSLKRSLKKVVTFFSISWNEVENLLGEVST